jgi:hypothetical protein
MFAKDSAVAPGRMAVIKFCRRSFPTESTQPALLSNQGIDLFLSDAIPLQQPVVTHRAIELGPVPHSNVDVAGLAVGLGDNTPPGTMTMVEVGHGLELLTNETPSLSVNDHAGFVISSVSQVAFERP